MHVSPITIPIPMDGNGWETGNGNGDENRNRNGNREGMQIETEDEIKEREFEKEMEMEMEIGMEKGNNLASEDLGLKVLGQAVLKNRIFSLDHLRNTFDLRDRVEYCIHPRSSDKNMDFTTDLGSSCDCAEGRRVEGFVIVIRYDKSGCEARIATKSKKTRIRESGSVEADSASQRSD